MIKRETQSQENFLRYYNRVIVALIEFKCKLIEPIKLKIIRKICRGKYIHECNPLVSIIIATYNRSGILVNRTIPTLLCQTYKNIEIVIVGDCCIDDTPIKIKSIKDPRVRFYDLASRGKYPKSIKNRWFVQGTKPRNEGMSLASGSWFVFISDDEILYPNHIETLLKAAKTLDVEFISAAYREERDGDDITVYPFAFDPARPDLVCGGMQTWMYRSYLKFFKWNIHSWRKTFNRPVDYDLAIRFYDCGVRMGYIKTIVGLNPAVEGTDTVGYAAALLVDKIESNNK